MSNHSSFNQTSDPANLDNRQRGQLAELIFMRKAASMGFSVSKPWQEGERYDLIVRADSSLWRIQVKSVLLRTPSRSSYRVNTIIRRSRKRLCYSRAEIDFLVAYIFPKDVWYIFPVEVVEGRDSFSVRPESKKCKSIQYREAWELMRSSPKDSVSNISLDEKSPTAQGP